MEEGYSLTNNTVGAIIIVILPQNTPASHGKAYLNPRHLSSSDLTEKRFLSNIFCMTWTLYGTHLLIFGWSIAHVNIIANFIVNRVCFTACSICFHWVVLLFLISYNLVCLCIASTFTYKLKFITKKMCLYRKNYRNTTSNGINYEVLTEPWSTLRG